MKKLLCIIITLFMLIPLSGCFINDYYRYLSINLETLTTYFKQSQSDFQNAADVFNSISELHMITKNKSWLKTRKDLIIKEYGSLIIISTKSLSEEQYNEIFNRVAPLFNEKKLEAISWFNKKLEFVYTSVVSGSNGWIYTPDGVEPDKEKNYIAEMERINENWYSCIWAS